MKKSTQNVVVAGLLIAVGLILVFWLGFSSAMQVVRHEQSAGFRLPPGSTEGGKTAFAELGCVNCHSVAGSAEFTGPTDPEQLHVVLGGEVRVVKTYGELVTAIIHPNESIRPDVREKLLDPEGNSIMPDLTRQMTTRQMIDLATYLQGQYKVALPRYPTNFYPYGIDVVP